MTARLLLLIILAQIALVSGQIFLKHGMNFTQTENMRYSPIIRNISAGILALTIWFLLWMGLMQKLDLSYLYPFEGMSPVLLVIATCIILKEKLDLRSWAGVCLIALGTFIVGTS
jgi:drug/metabolite transporter (DMT)-like permease